MPNCPDAPDSWPGPRPPQKVTRMTTTTIAVVNLKGGAGKSTTCQNLAAFAHLQGAKTLIRDGDPQGTSFQWYAARSPESRLRGLRVEHVPDVKLWRFDRFREVATGFDFVFCDTAASLDKITNSAAILADVVVVPMKPLHADTWAAAQTKELLDEADEQRDQIGLPPMRRIIVFNEVRPRTKDLEFCRQALEGMGLPLMSGYIGQRVAYSRALGEGESVHSSVDVDRSARGEIARLFSAVTAEGAQS